MSKANENKGPEDAAARFAAADAERAAAEAKRAAAEAAKPKPLTPEEERARMAGAWDGAKPVKR